MVNKSLLFPLTPYGKGTGDIEGFPSYLCRLAIAHSVSVVDLYNYLLTYGKRFSIVPFEFKRKKTLYLAALVSGSKQLRLLIKAIEELLGTSLQGTNFSMLGNGLSIPRRDISRSFKWCPVCLNEMEDEGIEPYIKLIWLLNDTLICNSALNP